MDLAPLFHDGLLKNTYSQTPRSPKSIECHSCRRHEYNTVCMSGVAGRHSDRLGAGGVMAQFLLFSLGLRKEANEEDEGLRKGERTYFNCKTTWAGGKGRQFVFPNWGMLSNQVDFVSASDWGRTGEARRREV